MKRIMAIVFTCLLIVMVIVRMITVGVNNAPYFSDPSIALWFWDVIAGSVATIALEASFLVLLIKRKNNLLRIVLPFFIGWLFIGSFASGIGLIWDYYDYALLYNILSVGYYVVCGIVTFVAFRLAIRKSLPNNKCLYLLASFLFILSLGRYLVFCLCFYKGVYFGTDLVAALLVVPELLLTFLYLKEGSQDAFDQIQEL